MILLIPGLRTVSELNMREHYQVKARRVRSQKNVVAKMLDTQFSPSFGTRCMKEWGRAAVTITRIAPGKLDVGDNLNSSGKHIRDAIALWLGIDDGSDLVEWRYGQEKSKPKQYSVRIEIAAAEERQTA